MPTTPTSAPVTPALDRLDDTIVALRRVLQRPGYRRALLQDTERPLELATLRLLRVVQRAPAAPSIGEVAEVLGVDPSTASRLVERAVDGGLLARRACDQDRRRTRLTLTDDGEDILHTVSERRLALLAEATEGWSAHDVAALLALLEQLLAGFDRIESAR